MFLRIRVTQVFLMALMLGLSIFVASPSTAREHLCFGRPISPLDPNVSGEIWGTEDPDVIDGSGGAYKIYGLGDDDFICGGGEDDEIYGDTGHDHIKGGGGNDTIDGGAGHDVIRGGNGDDHLTGDPYDAPTVGDDLLDGGPSSNSGGDWVYFSYRVSVNLSSGEAYGPAEGQDILKNLENVYGSPEHDTIVGDDSSNYLIGWDGNDIIWGRGDDDALNGMAGDDGLFGGDGAHDWVVNFEAFNPVTVDLEAGEMTSYPQTEEPPEGVIPEPEVDDLAGFEHIAGSGHADTLLGDEGSNYLAGVGGDDDVDGRGGFDVATFYNSVSADLTAGSSSDGDAPLTDLPLEGADTFGAVEGLWGSAATDTLIGDDTANLIRGDGDDDELSGIGGADYFVQEGEGDAIAGGAGTYDLVDYSLAGSSITVDLAASSGPGGDSLFAVEGAFGSRFADVLKGSTTRNYLFGDGGSDRLFGFDGNDHLSGGSGRDALRGGLAWDRCSQGEENIGCEDSAPSKRHPLVGVAAVVSRPATVEPRPYPPAHIPPRRHK